MNDDSPYAGHLKGERKVHKRVNNLDEIGPPEGMAEAGLKEVDPLDEMEQNIGKKKLMLA